MSEPIRVGLCVGCIWSHKVESDRGATFWRCARAETYPEFPKYPPLPVTKCKGFEAKSD